ncbi:unnamed protein product, partial [Brenthis ino]
MSTSFFYFSGNATLSPGSMTFKAGKTAQTFLLRAINRQLRNVDRLASISTAVKKQSDTRSSTQKAGGRSPSGRQDAAYFQSIREWHQISRCGEARGHAASASDRRPLLARYLARRQLVVFTAPHEKHARLSFKSARTRIMFQCLTNSIGGLGRSTDRVLHKLSDGVRGTNCAHRPCDKRAL